MEEKRRKVKELIKKHNLNISNKEIDEWIESEFNLTSIDNTLKDCSKDILKIIGWGDNLLFYIEPKDLFVVAKNINEKII